MRSISPVVILGLALALLPAPARGQTLPPPPSCHDNWSGGPYGVGWVCYGIGGVLPGCYPSLCQNADNIVACDPAPGATPCVAGLQWIGLTLEDKAVAGLTSLGLGAVSGALFLLPCGLCQLSSGWIGLSSFTFGLLAVDPYDGDYLETATPIPALLTSAKRDCIVPPNVPPQAENLVTCKVTAAEAVAANAYAANLSITIGLVQAIITTNNRGNSAALDGNQEGFDLQTAYLGQLKATLQQYVTAAGPLRERLAVVIERRSPDAAAALRNPDLTAAEAALASDL